jgi:hypothetical protein
MTDLSLLLFAQSGRGLFLEQFLDGGLLELVALLVDKKLSSSCTLEFLGEGLVRELFTCHCDCQGRRGGG